MKILKERPTDVPLEPLYPDPLVPAPAKVRDLKKMARDYLPSPQRNFYQDDDEAETEDQDSD